MPKTKLASAKVIFPTRMPIANSPAVVLLKNESQISEYDTSRSEDTFHEPTSSRRGNRSKAMSMEPEKRQNRSKSTTRADEVDFHHAIPILRKCIRGLQTELESENKEKCSLILYIHKIRDLECISRQTQALQFNCDCVTATAIFNEEEIKSGQVPRTQRNLTKDFTFEWEISEKQAKKIVDNWYAVAGDIDVTIQVEVDNRSGIKKWTHIIGTAQLPGKNDKDAGDGRWKTRLEPTNLEKGQQEITYSIAVVIRKTVYAI